MANKAPKTTQVLNQIPDSINRQEKRTENIERNLARANVPAEEIVKLLKLSEYLSDIINNYCSSSFTFGRTKDCHIL